MTVDRYIPVYPSDDGKFQKEKPKDPDVRKNQVVGFVFQKDWEDGATPSEIEQDKRYLNVLVIQKKRPSWMVGLWNGVGGSVEPGESPSEAMARETMEESGVRIPAQDWKFFMTSDNPRSILTFFYAFVPPSEMCKAYSRTDEKINIVATHAIHKDAACPDLHWQIEMALRHHRGTLGLCSPVGIFEIKETKP